MDSLAAKYSICILTYACFTPQSVFRVSKLNIVLINNVLLMCLNILLKITTEHNWGKNEWHQVTNCNAGIFHTLLNLFIDQVHLYHTTFNHYPPQALFDHL